MVRRALGIAVLVAGGVIAWLALRPRHEPAPRAAAMAENDQHDDEREEARAAPLPPPSVVPATPRPAHTNADGTVLDKKTRDDVRSKLLAAHGTPEGRATNAAAPAAPLPMADYDLPGRLEPKYIQERVREDFFPMARECYDAFLAKKPKNAAGKVVLEFTIVGDEKIGGIVESAEKGEGTTLDEPDFWTCMRESMLSVSFKPPEHGGKVQVSYPLVFSPGDDEPDE